MELSADTSFSTFWKIQTELQTKKQATFGEKYLWRQNHNDKPARVRRIFSRPGSAEKIQSQFCYLPDYPLQIKFLSLLETKAAKTSWERKTIKWATKLAIKRKANEKRREREKIKIGWKIVLCVCAKNKNAALKFYMLNYVQ